MFKIMFMVMIGFIENQIGGFDKLIGSLLLFMVMDYITGIMKAIINKNVSSEVGFKGIFKKILILFMIALANKIDILLDNVGIRYIAVSFYLINEGISIIENASIIGLPIPKKIKDTLEKLKND